MEYNNYNITEELNHSSGSALSCGTWGNQKKPVLIKTLKTIHASESDFVLFNHNIAVLKKQDIEGITKILDVIFEKDSITIIYNNIEGEPLDGLLPKGTLLIKDVLEYAIQISAILQKIHKLNLTHGNITPQSVFINPNTKKSVITDFNMINEITHEMEDLYNPDILSSRLPYISPEQTRRMERNIDYRSDLYSFGIILYEMLTGIKPFISKDPLELFHSHIAKMPQSPYSINNEIPVTLSNIVLKLISKNPEDRYQSSFGLMLDLKECLFQLNQKGKIDLFSIGRFDIKENLILPQKLYGRKNELNDLFQSLNRIAGGERELLLIQGIAGIGKSALVNELINPVIIKNGFFIKGKFEPIKMSNPFSAIITAFQSLVKRVLIENEDYIRNIKSDLKNAVGENGKIITDVIPEVAMLIGPQPNIQEVAPEEAQNRFYLVFQNFIKVFLKKNNPLVIFLDDIQWADSASLNLIHSLISDPAVKHLLIIAAFRDSDTNKSPHLNGWLEDIHQTGMPIKQIQLQHLNEEDISSFLLDTLQCSQSESEKLTELIHEKTGGNPFFIKQFLEMLYDENLLTYEREPEKDSDEIKGRWNWDIKKLKQVQVTDNVIDLMSQKIQRFPEETLKILKIAASIGNTFDLKTLSSIYDRPLNQTLSVLNILISNNLIYHETDSFSFVHDRIQEAAHSLIPEYDRIQLHYNIGTILLNTLSEDELSERLFDVVEHLNIGKKLIEEDNIKNKVINLNIEAGFRSKKATAYESARDYYLNAYNSLMHNSWEDNYNRTFTIHLELAECYYIQGNFPEADKLFDILFSNTQSLLDKAKVYSSKIVLLTNQNNYKDAVSTGIEALKLFNVKIGEKPSKLAIIKEFIKAKKTLKKLTIDDLINIEEMKEPDVRAFMEILGTLIQPTYFSSDKHHKEIMALVIFKLFNLTVKNGYTNDTPYVFVAFGAILCGKFGDYHHGYTLGQAGQKLNEVINNITLKAKVSLIPSGLINHWTHSARECLGGMQKAIKHGTDSGDLMITGNSITQLIYFNTRLGTNTNTILSIHNSYYNLLMKTKHGEAIDTIQSFYQMTLLYRGDTAGPDSYDTESFKEENFLDHIKDKKRLQYNYYKTKIESLYVFGYYEKALQFADIMREDIDEILFSVINIPDYYYFYSLIITALYPSFGKKEQKKYLSILKKNIKKLNIWSKSCPVNYLHQYLLIEAEHAGILMKKEEACILYNKAIEASEKNEYPNHEAIACECAAKFYMEMGNNIAGIAYIKRAIHKFNKMGANRKVDELRNKYKEQIRHYFPESDLIPASKDASTILDLHTVLQVSSAISSEIYLEKLLNRLIDIIIENAGATRGILILNRDDVLCIEAEGSSDTSDNAIIDSIPVDDYHNIPVSIINYVKRTQKPVVLQDASADSVYINDPYIEKQKTLSILCLPVIKQQELKAIFYLENSLATYAFSPERVEIIKLLSTDAATSLENSLLFERTRMAETEILQQYEEIHSQYDAMEKINLELKQTQSELLDANKSLITFKMFADATGHGFGMADLEGNQTYLNKALCKMIGFDRPEDVYGKKLFKYYPERIQEKMLNEILPTVMNKGQWIGESIIISVDGEEIPVIQNVFLIRDQNRQPFQLASVIIDINDRIAYEKALQRSEERYRLLVDTMNEGVGVADEQGIITYINSKLCEMIGYSPSELIGTALLDYFKESEKESMNNALKQILTDPVEPFETALVNKDGRNIYVIISPQAIIHDGQFKGSIGVITDITVRKKMEEELVKTSKLESLGIFAGGIAHDFNNILTAIIGNLSIALLNVKEEDINFSIISEAEKASLRAKDLTMQLLTFSKGGAPIKKITSLKDMLVDTIDFVLSGSNIDCEYNITPNLNNVEVDPGQISQVIHNLIINARQAMPEGGTIKIKAWNTNDDEIESLPIRRTKYICISITDEGTGIPEENLARIFDPYFTTKESGNGLGLAVSYSIIQKHDGIISIDSKEEFGTTVNVFIPSTDKEIPIDKVPEIMKSTQSKKILLMDDDETVLKVGKEMLKKMGHSVDLSNHGEDTIIKYSQALDLKDPYDLVIMDLTIPGKMGGKDAIAILKIVDPSIKAVVSSGYSNDPIMANYKDYGFTAILAKPYQFHEIQEVFNSIFSITEK